MYTTVTGPDRSCTGMFGEAPPTVFISVEKKLNEKGNT